ncbi:ABC transporter ATP-binding protein [Streptomyces sp. V4-01]|uniref:ABC transporter ATP-binding protein n=1 Tax=Actinacidiphila polyblastidii TaxID=3110430 RepID=A0ABU7PKA9_9ACTN|nr:ABC transporter ATP-binding protein [Streptomyces sp. V4-01]
MTTPLVEVAGLRIEFPTESGPVTAVDGLDFTLAAGGALGLVGESGSGKSATAYALLGLHRGTGARVTGTVRVAGTDLLTASDEELRALRGGTAAMIFQDPLSSLDPYYAIGDQIAEVHRVHHKVSRAAARARAVAVLDQVGIPDAARRARSRPHEFSGGMRQRALIAMALACEPRLIIADEPTTALDVTVQAQILDLLHELRAEAGVGLLLVTHDLGVAAGSVDELLVLRDGAAVERGPIADILHTPHDPYTRALVAAVPRLAAPVTVGAAGRPRARGASGAAGASGPAGEAGADSAPGGTSGPGAADSLGASGAAVASAPVAGSGTTEASGAAGSAGAAGGTGTARAAGADSAPRSASGTGATGGDSAPGGASGSGGGGTESAAGTASTKGATGVVGPRTGGVLGASGRGENSIEPAAERPLLEVTGLRREFGRGRTSLVAVDDVSLTVRAGETLGVVGESGSGKTTLGRMLVRLLDPSAGSIRYRGREIAGLGDKALRPLRRELQMVFQDPVSSLNPRRSIGESIADPLRAAGGLSEREIVTRVGDLLERVGLDPAWYHRYPHEFSGGQRQRVGIARALAPAPKLIVCDEPVSALDVTTQAQVVALLGELQRDLGLSMVFVAHDLAVVRQVSDRVAVMRGGRIVETGTVDEVYDAPQDPYTQALLAAVPVLDPADAANRRADRRELRRVMATTP